MMADVTVEREIRIAVVMYGGVSLAIYMNGVAHELLELVRSTSTATAPDRLSGTARIYRQLAQALSSPAASSGAPSDGDASHAPPVRFIVDIVSGTSAGGINAAMLAKALVRNADLEPLTNLWVEDGALDKLINDRDNDATRAFYHEPVRSLFNSDFMYLDLLKAMDALNASTGDPLVDDLSLAITGTDLAGRPVDLRLEDRIALEYTHRHAFQFTFARNEVDEFTGDYDPLLAFAARTTSSLPAAFEPTVARHAHKLAGTDRTNTDWGLLFRDVPEKQREIFETDHAFADGGYLDNKPFGHAIDRLSQTEGGTLVTRKLVYLEPLPAHIDPTAQPTAVPNALQNTLDVFTLARYETIHADLRRIEQRNRLVRRLRTLHAGVVEDGLPPVRAPGATDTTPMPHPNLDELVASHGRAYGGYHRLRVGTTTDDIANTIADHLHIEQHSDLRSALRLLARTWRREHYVRNDPDPNRRESAFLDRFDLRFHRRRAIFMLAKINQLLEFDPQVIAELANLTRGPDYPAIKEVIELHANGGQQEARDRWAAAGPSLRTAKTLAQRAAYAIHHGDPDRRLTRLLSLVIERNGDRLRTDLLRLLLPDSDAERAASADRLLEANEDLVDHLSSALAQRAQSRINIANDAFTDMDDLPVEPGLQTELRALVRRYWQAFVAFDTVQFPVLEATDFGEEFATVGVHRISATDTGFYGTAFARANKLKGASFGHFGAFLDQRWRRHDIRWGRLDGAERIIATFLGDDKAEERDTLIAQAHLAILREELPQKQAEIDALAHYTSNGMRDATLDLHRTREALTTFLQNLDDDLDLDQRIVARDVSRLLRVSGKLSRTLARDSRAHGALHQVIRIASWLATNVLAAAATIVPFLPLPTDRRLQRGE